jgi:hypothetical protein
VLVRVYVMFVRGQTLMCTAHACCTDMMTRDYVCGVTLSFIAIGRAEEQRQTVVKTCRLSFSA